LIEEIQALTKEGKIGTPHYAELKRRFGWEFNGMRLHEYYFENMTKNKVELNKDSAFYKKIQEDFGSWENWEKDFKSTGAMRGIGWAILYYDPVAKKLFNTWINERDVGHLSACPIILIMDVFEHAFMIDYGLKRADYIEAFFNAIDWSIVIS
jgi:Fe-Mn family superoxide dismutase